MSLHTQDEGEARVRVLAIAHETEKAIQRAREKHRALVVELDAVAKDWRMDMLILGIHRVTIETTASCSPKRR